MMPSISGAAAQRGTSMTASSAAASGAQSDSSNRSASAQAEYFFICKSVLSKCFTA